MNKTIQTIQNVKEIVENRLEIVNEGEGIYLDSLVKEQLLKKINSIVHNEQISELVLDGIVLQVLQEI